MFNERISTAAGEFQPASEQYAVKLARVYAMATPADDWEAEDQTCINVLCVNLRPWLCAPATGDADPPKYLAFPKRSERFELRDC